MGLTLSHAVTTLSEALGVRGHDVVAFVGAGGKTTALFRLARELAAGGGHPVVTTTTRILPPPESPGRRVLVERERSALVASVERTLAAELVPVAAVATTEDGKLAGLPPDWIDDLARARGSSHVLVEADGAARKPFKAPREGEPVIPAATTLVVAVVGVDAVGERVATAAHRPDRVAAITGLGPLDALDVRSIASVVVDERGLMKGSPAAARRVVLLNKADDASRLRDARALADELAGRGIERVVIAALERPGGVMEVRVRS